MDGILSFIFIRMKLPICFHAFAIRGGQAFHFKIMDILRLKELLDINALKFYYKYLRGTFPSYFYSFNITTQGENHSYNTHQSDQNRTNRTRTRFADNRLKIYLPPLINSVPTTLLKNITTHSIHGFSSSIKRYYIGNYSNTCSIPNCYICQRAWKLLYLKRNKAIFISFSFHYTIRSDVRKPS